MYFQPTNRLLEALVNAARRGVKIVIVTCGATPGATTIEQGFAPSNRNNLQRLLNQLTPALRNNVDYYEYNQTLKALHKKVLITDDYILAGSSNMGFKSLELSGDHKMNFIACSKELVEQTMKIIHHDIEKSRHVTTEEGLRMSIRDSVTAFNHRSGARFWG